MGEIAKIKVDGEPESSYQLYPRNEEFAKRSEGVQPDWNQNNETHPDYVKNRPFWREKTKELLVPLITEPIEVTTEDNGSGFFIATGEYFLAKPDVTNYVVFDGVEYTCEPHYDEEAGNLIIGSFDFSDYPFFIAKKIIATKTAGNHTVLQYYAVNTVHADYAPHLAIRTLKTADGTPYLAMDDVEKIKIAYRNGVPIMLNIVYGNYDTVMRVDLVSDSFIHASGFGSKSHGVTEHIECLFNVSNGKLYESNVSHLGSIKESGISFPVMYINNRYYKITVDASGTLTATEVT